MEQYSLLIKKYIFPFLIILTGILLLNTALFSGTGSIKQSNTFLLGSIVVLLMGVITLLYVKEIIAKSTHLAILAVLLVGCIYLGYSTYSSVNTTIAQIELKKEIDTHIKQGLRDIEIVQLEYKKKYGWYSDNFNELKRFLSDDSVYSISTTGVVPDHKITTDHAEILGYDPILDYIQMESYDEEEALKCGLLSKDTSWINVKEKLFPEKPDSSGNRIYNFDLSRLDYVPMSDDKKFEMKADILESSDDISFEMLLFKKGSKYNFVSANLIDFNGNDTAYYGKDQDGLIVKDSIPQIPTFLINDIVLNINETEYASSEDVYELIKSSKKDTLIFTILRSSEQLTINLTQKDIMPNPSRLNWSDLEDVFEYNLMPALYNPKDFEQFLIGKNMVIKEDEFSSPELDLTIFKNLLITNKLDTNQANIEIKKGISSKIDLKNNNKFILSSKIGTPVFTAFDPAPYDPLNERDTLITGSLTEVKTSGNWK